MGCAPPAERARLRRVGAAGVILAAANRPSGLAALEDDFLPSREDIATGTAELDGRIKAFGREVFSGISSKATNSTDPTSTDSFLTAWNSFVAEWADWRDVTVWFLVRTRRDELLGYRQRFNDLVAWFRRIPGAPAPSSGSVAQYTPDKTGEQQPGDELASALKWVAVGGMAIAGAMVVSKVLGFGKAFTPAGLLGGVLHHNPARRRRRRRRR